MQFNARKRNLLIALSCLSALYSSATLAQQKEDKLSKVKCESRQDNWCWFDTWYVQVGIGQAQGDTSQADVVRAANDVGFDVFDVDIDDTRTAWKFSVGTTISDSLTLEVGYTDLGDVGAAFSTVTASPDEFFALTQNIHPTSVDGFTVSLNWAALRLEDWLVNLRIGGFIWEGDFDSFDITNNRLPIGDTTSDGVDIMLGIGVHYALNDDWQLAVEYDHYEVDNESTGLLTAGFLYRFD